LKERTGLRGAEQWIDALVAAKWICKQTLVAGARVRAKENLGIRALPADPNLLGGLTTQQARLYSMLEPGIGSIPLQELLRAVDCTPAVAKALQRKGLVEIANMPILREPDDLAATAFSARHSLTEAQRAVLEELCRSLDRSEPARFLLHGVTGSGKTEIYLGLIAEVIRRGETALLLVPEIGLTPVLTRLVVSRFPGLVSLLHSGMSAGERLDQWQRIREQKASVVVGTRSAVFAPLEKPRLIIIDEEQDSSYKQDESPCYHAREVAWNRLQRTRGVLLLGSATPSIETYHMAASTGEITPLCLPERIEAKPLPAVSIVDMNLEFRQHGKKTAVSDLLHSAVPKLRKCLYLRGVQRQHDLSPGRRTTGLPLLRL
jgi:primosomal protein N' (replication factor Y)